MPKIYVKTIVLVTIVVLLTCLRLELLKLSFPIPPFVYDVFIGGGIVAIIVNEKFTKGERWTTWHYIFVLLAMMWIFYVRFAFFPV